MLFTSVQKSCASSAMTKYSGGELASILEDADVAASILAKHSRSSQPESKQICVVLGAVTEVLKDEGYNPTPTAYFAAVMSLLEKPETQESPQVEHHAAHLGNTQSHA